MSALEKGSGVLNKRISRREFIAGTGTLALAFFLGSNRFLKPSPALAEDCYIQGQDYDIENGHFFEQTAGEPGKGFAVIDDESAKLWAEAKRMGIWLLGFPISQRFSDGEVIYQAFQRAILKWIPEWNQAITLNILDKFSALGFDQELEEKLKIPKAQSLPVEGNTFEDVRQAYEGAFLTSEAITTFYKNHGGFWTFGLPTSAPWDFGDFTAQRFACMSLELWKTEKPNYPTPGSIAPALVGYFALEKKLIPSTATIHEEAKNFNCPEVTQKYKGGDVVYRGDQNMPYIYLTIDDGWSPTLVEKALEIANQNSVKITFFPVGRVLKLAPELWKKVMSDGHAIENHSMTHRFMTPLSKEDMRWEILAQQDLVREVLGDPNYKQHFFRPPGGGLNGRLIEVCRELGLQIAMWSSDSNGWRMSPREDQDAVSYTLNNVFANFYNGTIILQHAVPADIVALPSIINEAKRNNFRCITLTQGITI
jgi:peptidoglycan/xylan/chitin deacetylase (PgdA/CDA1 family)